MKTDHDAASRGSTNGADPSPEAADSKSSTSPPRTAEGVGSTSVDKPAETPAVDKPAEPAAAEKSAEPAAAEKSAEPAAAEKSAEPAAVDKPAEKSPAEEPAAEKPVEPVADKPAADKPDAEEPVAEKPAEPVADKPAAEEPVAEKLVEPVAEKPTAPAAVEEPTEPEAADGPDGAVAAGTGEETAAVPVDKDRTGLLGRLFPPRTTKAKVLVAVVALVTLGALGGLGFGGYWLFTRLPDGVAFRVKGVDVTEAQLDEQMQTLTALYGVQPPTNDPARMDSFRRDAAKSTAMAMTIDNAAAERKVVVADRLATDFLTKYVSATYGDGQAGRDAFIKDLADKGTSEPKVLTEIRRQLTNKQLFEQVTADIAVSDQDVRQAFDQRKDEFATPERREIHNIVVQTRPEAEALLAELNAGANFEALAPQRSLDSATKDSGGNLGLVSARDLQKGYADAAFSAPVGALIGPIETVQKTGPMYNVGKVVSTQPSVPADFEQIKEGVRRLLVNERANTRWREFMEEQIREADVKYADKYRPADPTGLPPVGNEAGTPAPPK